MEVKRVGSVKQGDEVIGNEVTVKVTKNKVAPPFKEARFNVMYGTGISRIGEVLDVALELGIASKSGAWFSYGEERLGQGRVNVENMLKENKELYERIEKDVLKAIRPDLENAEAEDVTEEVAETEEKPVKSTRKKAKATAKEDEEIELEVEEMENE